MKQITSRIDMELHKIISEMADKNDRSFDYTVYVLLQYAVKEKSRKKKENNSQYNPTDIRKGYARRQNILSDSEG